ncbi:MAG: hypothetical protein OXN88_00515, partial [Chloroflexota bacterium]|nr:hypothetical protein [Chloroflexota bacterium]
MTFLPLRCIILAVAGDRQSLGCRGLTAIGSYIFAMDNKGDYHVGKETFTPRLSESGINRAGG